MAAPTPSHAHRPLLGLSGVVMFFCLLLPSYTECHGCNSDWTVKYNHVVHYPLESFPDAFVGPYLLGLAIAVCAFAFGRRSYAAVLWTVRALLVAVIVLEVADTFTTFMQAAGAVCFFIATLFCQRSQLGLAIIMVVLASLDACYFGFLNVISQDWVAGSVLALMSSVAAIVGTSLWIRASVDRVPPPTGPPQLPTAIVRYE
jgi:hypothetical protein